MKSTIRRGVAIGGAVALAAAMAVAIPTAADAAPSRHALAKSAPSWLGKAHHAGRASTAGAVNFRVYLQPRGGQAALESAVAAVSTPGSASYGKYLSAPQYHKVFDPTADTVNAVRAWLQSQGMQVRSVAANNVYLQVSGTVAQAQTAFTTTIGTYTHDGQTVQANATPLSVPDAVAGSVLTVTGIDTTRTKVKAQDILPPPGAGFKNGRPCSLYYGQLQAKLKADYQTPLPKFGGKYLPFAVCGYTGPQFRSAYEGNSDLDGSGVTVGIVDAYASPTIAADAQQYATMNGDAGYAKGQLKQTNAKNFTDVEECGASGWYGEETLDVEAVHAMAPAAKIHYYGTPSCFDDAFMSTLRKVVNQNDVSIVSNSWGDLEVNESAGNVAAYHMIFLQAALQGISFMFSSGDDGDELESSGLRQADYPTSDSAVSSIGGTSTGIDGSGKLSLQTGWGTEKYSLSANGKSWSSVGYLYGAGGGYSTLFDRPSYQNGVVPAAALSGRAVPDVAMDADPTTGMLVGQTQTFSDGVYYGQYRIGGTSLASPLFAGMTALASQHAGRRLGFLNPTLYAKAGSSVFTDIKGTPADAGNVRVDYANAENPSGGLLYSVRTFNQDSSLSVAPGWDDVTGVGVPKASWLTSFGS